MSSRLFQSRMARRATIKTSADEIVPPVMDANPVPQVSFCKQWPTEALIAVSEVLTKLDAYSTDKSVQEAVVALGEELASRPPAPTEQPAAPAAPKVSSQLQSRQAGIPPNVREADGSVNTGAKKAEEKVIAPGEIDKEFEPASGDIIEPGEIDKEFEPASGDIVEPGELVDEFEDIDYPKAAHVASINAGETKLKYAAWVEQQREAE